jgi:hypothetical protein
MDIAGIVTVPLLPRCDEEQPQIFRLRYAPLKMTLLLEMTMSL